MSSSVLEREIALISYLRERKSVHFEVLKKESESWTSLTNDKSLWSRIDWKGNYSRKKPVKHPSVNEFQLFFEDLYSCDNDELSKKSNLQSNVNIR